VSRGAETILAVLAVVAIIFACAVAGTTRHTPTHGGPGPIQPLPVSAAPRTSRN
jgi:hypothetical protein